MGNAIPNKASLGFEVIPIRKAVVELAPFGDST